MIVEVISPEIHQFLKQIEELGFSLCLVGGITRDYFYTHKLGDDFDFEIRPAHPLDSAADSWPQYYKKLHDYLIGKKISFEELPYLITRVRYLDKNFEFSSPRTELALPSNFSHHHFQASLDPTLSYQLSFKRRDFTINTIGLELSLKPPQFEKIVDPYKGLEDLKNGILKNVSEDFFLDSVRFLRLIRFQIKFDKFVIEDNLFSKLHLFNLVELSTHYFKEELFKSRPGEFLNLFASLVTLKQLLIPEKFKFWIKYTFPKALSTKEELLAWVFLQNEADADKVSSFFSMPEKKLRDLKSFHRSYQAVLKLEKKDFLNILQLPTEEALKHSLFKELKNLEEKKEWKFILGLGDGSKKLLIEWSDWKDVTTTPDELATIAPPLRSYFLYFKALKEIFIND